MVSLGHIQSFISHGLEPCFTGQSYLGKSTAGTALALEMHCIKFRNMMMYNHETLVNFFIIELAYHL